MKERLLNALGSNRAVAITYDPELDCDREDIPCLQFLQAFVRDGELTIHCMFRSNDIFGAFYSNMFFITYIGIKLREELNKELINEQIGFGGIHYHSKREKNNKKYLGKEVLLIGSLTAFMAQGIIGLFLFNRTINGMALLTFIFLGSLVLAHAVTIQRDSNEIVSQ